MVAIADLSWNKIIYAKKDEKVELLSNSGKYSVFKNLEGIEFKVSKELVSLYFREVIKI